MLSSFLGYVLKLCIGQQSVQMCILNLKTVSSFGLFVRKRSHCSGWTLEHVRWRELGWVYVAWRGERGGRPYRSLQPPDWKMQRRWSHALLRGAQQ